MTISRALLTRLILPFGPSSPLPCDALVYVDGAETASLTGSGGSTRQTVSLATGERTPGNHMTVDLYGSNGGSASGSLYLVVGNPQATGSKTWSLLKSLYR